MNVGDYVRTKNKGIKKIIGLYSNAIFDGLNRIENQKIFKSSPQIIDLIEVGDLMYIDISPDNCGGIVVPRIAETLRELDKYKEKLNNEEYILKYIVTHEQISNQRYKVGG